ncbi:MAG TPA: LPXTG cell wall anchor domain-containing protein [Baekduia sp.]|nr:LPXTG cell wall anchor domain-containing protein [Baekduia sp.]
MPSVCRRIVVLLVVALLGVGGVAGSVTSAFAQGAGDQQYQDPFGGDEDSGSSGSGNSNSNSSSGSGGDIDPITPSPQTSGAASGSGTSGSSGASAAAGTAGSDTGAASPSSPAASGRLPNTGLDARVLVLAGIVLVLVGFGLRLRNAPERS